MKKNFQTKRKRDNILNIYIENETEFMSDFDFNGLFEKVSESASDYLDIPYEISVNILLTDDDGIHEINQAERGIDRPTDVLSFPALEFETPGDFSNITDDQSWLFDPETGELMLGDIVISLETAKRQAEEYGHSIKRELAFLCAHSLLHLSGFDHMEDNEREIMEDKQREILDRIGITRDYE